MELIQLKEILKFENKNKNSVLHIILTGFSEKNKGQKIKIMDSGDS